MKGTMPDSSGVSPIDSLAASRPASRRAALEAGARLDEVGGEQAERERDDGRGRRSRPSARSARPPARARLPSVPDFMDLLVVCADAGLSMEAALDRVGRELANSYRSLSANIHMATLEMRAGRTLSETLDHLADRLGLEEARSFATLLQQSEKLGSSLTEALRVYSDDMRHKRMSRAEEKAYSLPAKLSVPLTLCVFPVVIIVILLPVYVRLKVGNY